MTGIRTSMRHSCSQPIRALQWRPQYLARPSHHFILWWNQVKTFLCDKANSSPTTTSISTLSELFLIYHLGFPRRRPRIGRQASSRGPWAEALASRWTSSCPGFSRVIISCSGRVSDCRRSLSSPHWPRIPSVGWCSRVFKVCIICSFLVIHILNLFFVCRIRLGLTKLVVGKVFASKCSP